MSVPTVPSTKLLNEECRFLIVDPTGILKSNLGDILRSYGYKKIKWVQTSKECMTALISEEVDWVIAYLRMGKDGSGLKLLRYCISMEEEVSAQVSLIIDQSDKEFIPICMSMGMLAFHIAPITNLSLNQDIGDIREILKSDEHDPYVSLEYLRKFLKQERRIDELKDLEQAVFNQLGAKNYQLLHLADSFFLSGKKDEGLATLHEALLFDPEVAKDVDEMAKEYCDADLKAVEERVMVKSCIIVDSDISFTNSLKEILTKMNAVEIHTFDSGEEALEFIKKGNIADLMITEWKLKGLSGSAFIQRAHLESKGIFPIIVYSGLVRKQDKAILEEIGVAEVITKPQPDQYIIEAMIKGLRKAIFPRDTVELEKKIRFFLAKKDLREANRMAQSFYAHPEVDDHQKFAIQAELKFLNGEYETASSLAMKSLGASGSKVQILNLLGKCKLKLGNFQDAVKCFESANKLAPGNIERLCLMAESHANLGAEEESQEFIEQARTESHDAPIVHESEVKVASALGNTDKAQDLLKDDETASRMVSFWNNQAVAYIRNGLVKEGIEIYLKAFKLVSGSSNPKVNQILYNLGLAYVRKHELPEAKKYLTLLLKREKGSYLEKKGKSLYFKMKTAMENGTRVLLSTENTEVGVDPAPEENVEEQWFNFMISNNLPVGKLGLFGVYSFRGELPKGIELLL